MNRNIFPLDIISVFLIFSVAYTVFELNIKWIYDFDVDAARIVFETIIYFFCAISFLAGIGVLLRRRWGVFFLKVFMWMAFPAFPIGTIFSLWLRSYLKNKDIYSLFR